MSSMMLHVLLMNTKPKILTRANLTIYRDMGTLLIIKNINNFCNIFFNVLCLSDWHRSMHLSINCILSFIVNAKFVSEITFQKKKLGQ
jgi:hypothetical protein